MQTNAPAAATKICFSLMHHFDGILLNLTRGRARAAKYLSNHLKMTPKVNAKY